MKKPQREDTFTPKTLLRAFFSSAYMFSSIGFFYGVTIPAKENMIILEKDSYERIPFSGKVLAKSLNSIAWAGAGFTFGFLFPVSVPAFIFVKLEEDRNAPSSWWDDEST